MNVTKMRMLAWMFGETRRDRIKNEQFREHLGVALIGDKLSETCLRWSGDVQCRLATMPLKRSFSV